MAKLSGFKCDRCGMCYDKNKSKDHQHRTDFNLVAVGLINTAGQLYRTDLCDDCMAALQTWLNTPEAYVATEEEYERSTAEEDMLESE